MIRFVALFLLSNLCLAAEPVRLGPGVVLADPKTTYTIEGTTIRGSDGSIATIVEVRERVINGQTYTTTVSVGRPVKRSPPDVGEIVISEVKK